MQLRKISIFTLLAIVLLIFSISTINAATINDTSTGGIEQGITDTDPNDTLFLEEGTYNKSSDRGITINKNITIQGKGPANKVIIDAQGLSRIFAIGNIFNVTFINITFINANDTGYGGAVDGSNVQFINCNFNNNSCPRGSAVNGANNTFIGCNFSNNLAGNQIGTGGAIYMYSVGSWLNIVDCVFSNNTGYYGGVIYTATAGTLTIVNSSFSNNRADFGGAVFSSSNLIINNSSFYNNSAIDGGGAVRVGGNIIIEDSIFINNNANSGGAVLSQNGNVTVRDSNFINNSAIIHGGSLSIEDIYNLGDKSHIIDNTNITGSNADKGGGIYINSPNHNLTINNSNIIKNTALNGVLYIDGCSNLVVDNSTIDNNIVNDNSAIIITENATLNINNSAINNNSGGGIVNEGTSSLTNNIISGNNGYGIVNHGNLSVSDNIMSGNTATTSGNTIYNNGTMGILNLIYLSNSTIKTSKGSTVTIYATLTDDMGNTVTGQDISFYVDGVFIANVTSIEGKANITYLVTKDPVSLLPVTGDYAGHGGYSIITKNGALLIPKIPTNETIDVARNLKVGQNTTLESRLTDKDGKPIANATIDFYINGKKIGSAITDSNGLARLYYTFTKAGSYNVQAKYPGNDIYEASSANAQTTVFKTKTNLEIETDEDTITVTLTDEDGNQLANKKITIKVGGETLTGIIDSNGQLIIYYPNANKYKVTAKFAGNDQYNPSNATVSGEPIPDEPTNKTSNNPAKAKTAAMKETGIPVITLLLVLLSSLGLVIRKKQ